MKKIAFIVSSPMTVASFLSDQLVVLSRYYNVTVITNMEDSSVDLRLPSSIEVIHVPICRTISLTDDLYALCQVIKICKKKHFDLVHSVTPKAGIVSMIGSFIARVPVRVHTFTGQVWATKKGGYRLLLKSIDKVIARLATHVLVDSSSQLSFLRTQNILSNSKGSVLLEGSISGVDIDRFSPSESVRKEKRDELGIPDDALVLLFLGRINTDKGMRELIDAYILVTEKLSNCFLLIVGPDEEEMIGEFECALSDKGRYLYVPYTTTPEDYMRLSDLLCLPSYREGFGSVIIEAAAVGIPSVGTDIYGLSDAIVDGKTGVLVNKKDVSSLLAGLLYMLSDSVRLKKMGFAARERAVNSFSQKAITNELVKFYGDRL